MDSSKYGYMALFHKNASFLRGDLSLGLSDFLKKVNRGSGVDVGDVDILFDTRGGDRPNPPALLVSRVNEKMCK